MSNLEEIHPEDRYSLYQDAAKFAETSHEYTYGVDINDRSIQFATDFAASVLADSEKRLEEAQKSLRQIAAVASQAISRERIAKKAQTVRPNVIKREANDGQ